MLNDWPHIKTEPNHLDYPKGLSKWPEHGRILNAFIGKYNYQVKWENEKFQLLLVDK